MKIVSIVGTRPNFTKEYVICDACRRLGVEEVIVHTGQHYDYAMSQKFFEELTLPTPKYINEIIKGAPGYETATMLAFIEQVLVAERPDLTLVYGDVNSTMAGALASVKQRIPVAHIEAGLRTPFRYNPEEINRRVADSVSELLFPHIREADESLRREGYPRERVFLHGDIVNDAVRRIVRECGIAVTAGNYLLVTVHRAENTDDPVRLAAIVDGLLAAGRPCKFPVHPRTRDRLQAAGLYDRLAASPHLELLEPLGFVEFIRLLAGCDKFVTDSGSARREAYILKKPVITLTDIVWVREMVECGWDLVADADAARIVAAVRDHRPDPARYREIFGDGHAAEKIVRTLLDWHAGRGRG